ncbi:hypothetical protein PC116_g28359 [Phytophthora cactorum]|uniref:Uncharacterized protein n=1 Tax=Phytophthora cactorum TaxID=29920 RepID=A0A8T1JIF7_9STRA|nr:hypothetical protein PC113_g23687 [Phytophthora cactorum]KAG2872015.1 hypothetical protein PC114_g26610 [Phytophthora cactorum]KAG2876020.1 hypothetical protein PC115_g23749 [Phytophthora cactorum]KAG2957757.1 hypothetical protein PC118_g23870 [Phytophthora cactorum]KAG4223170.1 hypothetical protein PC116_g28359 [Phytophthora cactorum]
MFSYNKTAALCLAVVAFSSGVNAKEEAAQTFGLLGAGLHGGAGVGAGVGAGLYGNRGGCVYPTLGLHPVFFSNYSCLMPRLSRVHPDATSTGRQHCVRML